MRVFVTGGTGLVGKRLVHQLVEQKKEVVVLSRRPAVARATFGSRCTVVEGDPSQAGPWQDSVRDCDAVIHLAGENIFARRWSEDFKRLLRDSRIRGTTHVVEALSRQPTSGNGSPKVLVSASAIGYYGPRGDEELTEEASPGDDLLARLCIDWEKAARAAEARGIRVAIVRVGVVLDKEGGALTKMLTPFRLFAGGPIGSGKQWVSWIHHEDLVGILTLPLQNPSVCGPLNGTAPEPLTNKEFGHALGRALGRPSFMPTPAFALRLMLGEVADVITKGQRVVPRRSLGFGYQFKYPQIDAALKNILAG